MAAYRFLKPYRSSFGQWSAGDTADFDDDTAAWLGRDEPGCLGLVADEVQPDPVDDTVDETEEITEEAEDSPEENVDDESEEAAEEDPDDDEESRDIDAPPSDRMVRKAPKKRATQGGEV